MILLRTSAVAIVLLVGGCCRLFGNGDETASADPAASGAPGALDPHSLGADDPHARDPHTPGARDPHAPGADDPMPGVDPPRSPHVADDSPPGGGPGRAPSKVYLDLREIAFGADARGVIMETTTPDSSYTVVALDDDTVSIYLSQGGGILGSGQHAGPRRISAELRQLAEQHRAELQPTADHALPRPGRTKLYLLTGEGKRVADVEETDLQQGRHALSPVYHKAHDLFAEARKSTPGAGAP